MNNNHKKKQPTTPFFARFLEEQQLQDVTGGKPNQTLKFPSDSDETAD